MSVSEKASPFARSSPKEGEIYQVLGDWISSCVGDDFSVLQGQQNRAPPPLEGFILMVITNKERLSTNSRHYQADQSVRVEASFIFTIRLTCIGEGSGEAINLLKNLWRDLSCCGFFEKNLPTCAPVDADTPRQDPLITPEKQYEDKWGMDLRLNVLTTTFLQQEMMNNIHLNITSI